MRELRLWAARPLWAEGTRWTEQPRWEERAQCARLPQWATRAVRPRAPVPLCLVDLADCFPRGVLPPPLVCSDRYSRFMLPEEKDVADVAALITKSFYEDEEARDDLVIPEFALEELRNTVPLVFQDASPSLQERWRSAYNGLRSRSWVRFGQPDLQASLESTLILTVCESRPGRPDLLTCCCELSLKPVDGRLPSEALLPQPQRQIGFAPPAPPAYGAYLANLGVRSSHRRRGLARMMLGACEWVVREVWGFQELYLHVDLHNTAAASLYATTGFEQLPSFDYACQPAAQPSRAVHHRYHRKRLLPPSSVDSSQMLGVTRPSRIASNTFKEGFFVR